MATKGERSILSVLHGGQLVAGVESELASPLGGQGSANIPLLARAAVDLQAYLDHDTRTLAESSALWEEYLEPGRPGLMMEHEFGSAVYAPWIVLPISLAHYVHRSHAAGQLAAARAADYCRAWLGLFSLTVGWIPGKLISDDDDPPGGERPGPVYATATVDHLPWGARTHRGVLPCVAVGERSWWRSHDGDDNWRLGRAYLDQHQIAQIVQLALGLPWHFSDTDDWPAAFASGLRKTFGPSTKMLPIPEADLDVVRAARLPAGSAARAMLLGWLDAYRPQHTYTLTRTTEGLWMLAESGGRTSTAPLYGAVWHEAGLQGWLACDGGGRKSPGAPDAIVSGRGWESATALHCERSDGRFGRRTLSKPAGADVWRLELGSDGYSLTEAGQPAASPGTGAPAPVPEPVTPPTPGPDAGTPGPVSRPAPRRRGGLFGFLRRFFG